MEGEATDFGRPLCGTGHENWRVRRRILEKEEVSSFVWAGAGGVRNGAVRRVFVAASGVSVARW